MVPISYIIIACVVFSTNTLNFVSRIFNRSVLHNILGNLRLYLSTVLILSKITCILSCHVLAQETIALKWKRIVSASYFLIDLRIQDCFKTFKTYFYPQNAHISDAFFVF